LVVKTGNGDEAQCLIATPMESSYPFSLTAVAKAMSVKKLRRDIKEGSKVPFHGAGADFTDDKNKQKSLWRSTLTFTI
jgi:hypothetical protein